MKQKYLIIKIIPVIVCLFIFSNNSFARPGSAIIENANQYLTWQWTCNERNARPENRVEVWDYEDELGRGGRDWTHPFFPAGVEIGPDPDGPEGPLAAPTATGQHIGMPYATGLRDTRALLTPFNKGGYRGFSWQ